MKGVHFVIIINLETAVSRYFMKQYNYHLISMYSSELISNMGGGGLSDKGEIKGEIKGAAVMHYTISNSF